MTPITFTNEDLETIEPAYNAPMIITVDIDNFSIMKTLVDQGSLIDILYSKTFKKMRIPE